MGFHTGTPFPPLFSFVDDGRVVTDLHGIFGISTSVSPERRPHPVNEVILLDISDNFTRERFSYQGITRLLFCEQKGNVLVDLILSNFKKFSDTSTSRSHRDLGILGVYVINTGEDSSPTPLRFLVIVLIVYKYYTDPDLFRTQKVLE